MSDVGFIFKLENISTGCFGDYSMKTAVIYNNDTPDGEKKSNRPRSGRMDLVDLKLVVVMLACLIGLESWHQLGKCRSRSSLSIFCRF